MILRSAKTPFIALGLLCVVVIIATFIGLNRGRVLGPEVLFVGVVLFVHYLYLSRLRLELHPDEVIYRTLFKTVRVRLGDLGSINYEQMAARRSGQLTLVLRLKPSNRPVALLTPSRFGKEEWIRFVGDLERRSGLRLNVASYREIPTARAQPPRLGEALLMLGILVALLLTMVVDKDYPYLEAFPAATVRVGWGGFVIALVVLGAAREKLAPWAWQEGPVVVWLGLVGAAILIAFLSVGLMKFANGVLDRTPAHYQPFTVVRRASTTGYGVRVRPAAATHLAQKDYAIAISWDDWETAETDDVFLVDVRPGFLHLPWVAGYRTCGDSKCGY